MTEAINRPVLSRRKQGASDVDDFDVGQAPDVVLPATGSVQRESDVILPVENGIGKEHLAELAFMEEPMTIYIEPSGEENSAQFADVAVNGKKAEVWDEQNQRWIPYGFLPVGREITTKRKYVEVLARSKPQKIRTEVKDPQGDPRNVVQRFTHSRYPFSVLEDRNPQGRAWLARIKAEG